MRQSLVAMMALGLAVAACSTGSQTPTTGGAPESPPVTPPTIPVIRPASPAIPPDVDLSRHSVPLDEVFFDTFDGGAVPLSASTPELRSRLLDAIPPIDEPAYESVGEAAWLSDDDLVLGYVAGDRARAYPFKILNFHEIVNDVVDDRPVLISYCPLCRSGVVYDRTVAGDVLTFGNTSALYESDLVMVDRATGSYWWQVAGKAIVGQLTDTELVALPSEVSTWADWRVRHPDGLVLSRDTGFDRPYSNDSFAGYAEVLEENDPPFSFGTTSGDDRLPPNALVVAVQIDGTTKVYPVDDLRRPFNDVISGVHIVVLPVDGGAGVFEATVAGDRVAFTAADGGFVDDLTGSTWTGGGVAVAGELAGTTLTALPIRTSFWFAMIGAFPDLELYSP